METIFQSIEILSKEKGIDPQIVLDAVKDAMLIAARKHYRTNEDYVADMDPKTGAISLYAVKKAVEDVTDLAGSRAERWRRWDSCFTVDFSYIHGGSVRATSKSRYRQWLTHKLATWIDQFGQSGCVGCGRCITWCPVGIDITAEVRSIRDSDASSAASDSSRNSYDNPNA